MLQFKKQKQKQKNLSEKKNKEIVTEFTLPITKFGEIVFPFILPKGDAEF